MTDDVTHAVDSNGQCWLSGPGFSGLPCSLADHRPEDDLLARDEL